MRIGCSHARGCLTAPHNVRGVWPAVHLLGDGHGPRGLYSKSVGRASTKQNKTKQNKHLTRQEPHQSGRCLRASRPIIPAQHSKLASDHINFCTHNDTSPRRLETAKLFAMGGKARGVSYPLQSYGLPCPLDQAIGPGPTSMKHATY